MAIPADLPEFQTAWERFTAQRGFDDIAVTLGLEPEAADGESISMRMPLTTPIMQANGMYAAAALFGAADITSTFLSIAAKAEEGRFPLAVQSNQHFLSNTKDPSVVATARLLRSGGAMVVTEAEVRDDAGRLLMQATFTNILKTIELGN
ncbi:MAG: PaaI family thioesterase [Microbacteriaceae bacterium]|nr:PaaI family thioesterase [Microbacteriaceae bacterium]